jgi:hypothetical protein
MDEENKSPDTDNQLVVKLPEHTGSDLKIDGVVPPKKGKFFDKLKNFWSKPKNRIITESVLGLIIITLVGLILLKWYNDQSKPADNTPTQSKVTQSAPVEEKATGILSGVLVSPDLATRHPLGVIVENQIDARPQSGVSSADMVYEAIAEGGITRYLCLYSSQDAAKVGPIRSARTYFVDIVREFGAFFAHVGGNYDALQQIIAQKINNLDQFQNSGYYYRDTSRNVASEHTMYSSTAKLYQLAGTKGYPTDNTFTALKFKTEAVVADRPASQKITVEFGSSDYKVVWDYSPTLNSYLRTLGGLPDQDASNGQRLAPKNLIIQEVTRTATVTAINEKGYTFQLVGSGSAQIFRDGKLTTGTWKKASGADRTIFSDASGQEIALNPGQTWVEIVHPELKVTVQ